MTTAFVFTGWIPGNSEPSHNKWVLGYYAGEDTVNTVRRLDGIGWSDVEGNTVNCPTYWRPFTLKFAVTPAPPFSTDDPAYELGASESYAAVVSTLSRLADAYEIMWKIGNPVKLSVPELLRKLAEYFKAAGGLS